MNKIENSIGFALLIGCVVWGSLALGSEVLFFRWLIGIGFGYVLTRAAFGFAGSVNRAYRGGSTRLMRALMLMFVLSASPITQRKKTISVFNKADPNAMHRISSATPIIFSIVFILPPLIINIYLKLYAVTIGFLFRTLSVKYSYSLTPRKEPMILYTFFQPFPCSAQIAL